MSQQPLISGDWDKVESKKGFFRSFARDWGKVFGGNAFLLLGNMIVFVIALCVVMLFLPMVFPVFLPDKLKEYILDTGLVDKALVTDESVNNIYYLMCMISSFALCGLGLVTNGPFCSAVSYYFKNVLIGENDFKADIKKGLKDNWKRSLGASVISLIITIILIYNIGFYQSGAMWTGVAAMAAKSFFFCLLSFWSCMQLFVYPLIACVELTFKEVYKNAALMTVQNFPIAILVFVIQLALFIVLPFLFVFQFGSTGYAIMVILYLLFSFGFIGYISMYLTWRAIQKVLNSKV
ncbi:MAG: DUF624 domain-containing protein [Clostridiales bacterium]|nr:DUF624 domain-containing protein [Clostridiales bacterium]MCR5059076.1 DUF624 domain-containing protein [Clostridiales bacterium]